MTMKNHKAVMSRWAGVLKSILVQVKDYDNKQLMQKHDELSIIMMINKMQESADFAKWKRRVLLAG